MKATNLLLDQLQETHYAHITIQPANGATFQDYLNFIEYQPESWTKSTDRRFKKLKKIEKWVKPSFENVISEERTTSQAALDVYRFMKYIDLDLYAKAKLTKQQLDKCYEKAIKLINYEEYVIENDEKVIMTYINYLIRMVSSNKEDNDIKKRIKRALYKK